MKLPFGPVLFAAFFCCAAALVSAEKPTFVYRASIMTILEDNGLEGDLAPVMPVPGIAFSVPLLSFLRFEPAMDLYYTFYGYSETLERAVPVAQENRSSEVYGFMLGLPLDFSFRIAKLSGFHVSIGMTGDLRLCLLADDSADARDEHDKIVPYFWENGRWLLSFASLGFDFPFVEGYKLGVDLRGWYPLYRLWTGEDLPAAENLRFALGLRLIPSAR